MKLKYSEDLEIKNSIKLLKKCVDKSEGVCYYKITNKQEIKTKKQRQMKNL